MLLFDASGVCVKEIGGAAVIDLPDVTVVDRPAELAGVPLSLLRLMDGSVVRRDLTAEELLAADDAALQAALNRGILKALYNHENRIRSLEGKAAITADQFKDAVKTILGIG